MKPKEDELKKAKRGKKSRHDKNTENLEANEKNEKPLLNTEEELVVEIALERLQPFKDHPFKVKDDEDMKQLRESISMYGIMNPLIVTPTKDGTYQIVSGHRRKHCAEQLGYRKVPVIIRVMQEDDAVISMVDSNLQRETITYSEKAFAYHMKNEALKHKSRKKRKTQEGNLAALRGDKIVDQLGEEIGVSPRQIMRFIRLTKLVPELLEMLDKGDISFNPAVELSFLKEEEQRWVLDGMDYTQSKPSLSQAKRFKMLSQEKKLTADLIDRKSVV